MEVDDPSAATLASGIQVVTQTSDVLPEGTRVGEYVIRKLIGCGGCATVYEAVHGTTYAPAAVKVMHKSLATSPPMVQRFLREVHIARDLHHPSIVDIFELGWLDDGQPFMAMELLRGETLSALLWRRGRLAPQVALGLLAPLCEALSAAHAAGIVHRDLKAGNIMVLEEEPSRIKLLDFGIAKLLQPEPSEAGLTALGQRIGTPHSTSPEQIRGGVVDARSDVYALGVLLFKMLTGELPFPGSTVLEVERMHLESPPPRPGALAPLSPAIDDVVLRCLEKSPDRRYPTVAALREALEEAVSATRPIAVHMERGIAILAAGHLEQADDEEATLLLSDVVDLVETELMRFGFTLVLRTMSQVLAVRLLPTDAQEEQRTRAAGVELGRSLVDAGPSYSAIRWTVCVRVDSVEVRTTQAGIELVGGGLLQTATWASSEAGLHVSEAAG